MYKELEYYYNNKQEILEKRKRRYYEDAKFREKCILNARMWNMMNRDKRKLISKEYYRKNSLDTKNVNQTTKS